jgi:dihydroneopterin aldolase
MDVIALTGISVFGKHGANPGEREREQKFDVDVKLELDLGPGERSDDLEQTVNYDALHKAIVRIVREHSYILMERLAGAVIDEIFRDARIAAAEVRIAKPRLLDGCTPHVTLRRQNPRFVKSWP